MFDSAAEIVEEVMLEEMTVEDICPTLPKPINIARSVNRVRQKLRPEDPADLNFELDREYLPLDFFQNDIAVYGRRHLLFASQKMIDLKSAKTWNVDATFKVVKRPFTQLWSIHAFVRSGTCTKQVPMMFVLMSGNRKTDFTAVLQSVVDLLPDPLQVRWIVADFEAATWEAIRSFVNLQHVEVKGCLFHFTQAIWLKVQDLRMRQDYIQDNGTRKICRLLMSLPLLPEKHIQHVFDAIRPQVMKDEIIPPPRLSIMTLPGYKAPGI